MNFILTHQLSKRFCGSEAAESLNSIESESLGNLLLDKIF